MVQPSASLSEVCFVCTGCKVPKLETEFHKNGSKESGRDSRCKRCISKLKKQFYALRRRRNKIAVSFTSVIVNRLSDEAAELCGAIFGDSIRELIDAGKL